MKVRVIAVCCGLIYSDFSDKTTLETGQVYDDGRKSTRMPLCGIGGSATEHDPSTSQPDSGRRPLQRKVSRHFRAHF